MAKVCEGQGVHTVQTLTEYNFQLIRYFDPLHFHLKRLSEESTSKLSILSVE